jgi:hypothetical protein
MSIVQILYIILGASIVVLTVTIVWLANEAIGLIKSLRRSSENTEVVTRELKEKVLVVSEALDRAGTAASTLIGLIEDGVEAITSKRDKVVSAIGLITGAGKHIEDKEEPEEEAKQENKEEGIRNQEEEVVEKPKEVKISEKKVDTIDRKEEKKEESSDTKETKEKEANLPDMPSKSKQAGKK